MFGFSFETKYKDRRMNKADPVAEPEAGSSDRFAVTSSKR